MKTKMGLCIAFHNKQETRQETIQIPATTLPTKQQPPFLILFLPKNTQKYTQSILLDFFPIPDNKEKQKQQHLLEDCFIPHLYLTPSDKSAEMLPVLQLNLEEVPNFLTNGELSIFQWINCICKLKTIHSMVSLTKQYGLQTAAIWQTVLFGLGRVPCNGVLNS